MSKVVDFPKNKRTLGIRMWPSLRIDGWIEVQRFEHGEWRSKAIFEEEQSAKQFLAELIVQKFASEHSSDDLGDIPF